MSGTAASVDGSKLAVGTYKEAHAGSLKRLSDLITEKCEETSIGTKISKNLALPAPRPRPESKPIAKTGELMLDAAMDKYLENVATSPRRLRVATATPCSSSMPLRAISSFLGSLGSSSMTSWVISGVKDWATVPSTIVWVKW